jgi:raffinose/stachyose/melibiose transport system permease protein
MAGVQRIDEVLYDAAKVDGANPFQQFIHVTLPGLRSEITVAIVTTLISALRVFDVIYVMTNGGPGGRTMTTSFLLIRNAFRFNNIGYASAIAVVQTLMILTIAYVVIRLRSDRSLK